MKKITRKKIRRHTVRFFIGYGIFLMILAIAAFCGYDQIRVRLTEYESAQTKYVAEKAFEMFASRDYGALFDYEPEQSRALTTRETYASYAAGLLDGKEITYRETVKGNTDEARYYTVYADGRKFASFTIRPSGQTTPHGYTLWTFDAANIHLLDGAYQSYSISCYTGNRVFVDGEEVPLAQMRDLGALPGYEGHLKSGMQEIRRYEMTLEDRLIQPMVAVLDASGQMTAVEPDEQGRYVIEAPWQDAELKESREKWIVNTAKAISQYTIGHATIQEIGNRVDTSSPAYKNIQSFDRSIIFNHYKFEFENIRTENYYSFSDSYFSVDVYYDFVVYYYESTRTYETAYRFFYHRVDDKWMLYDFTTL